MPGTTFVVYPWTDGVRHSQPPGNNLSFGHRLLLDCRTVSSNLRLVNREASTSDSVLPWNIEGLSRCSAAECTSSEGFCKWYGSFRSPPVTGIRHLPLHKTTSVRYSQESHTTTGPMRREHFCSQSSRKYGSQPKTIKTKDLVDRTKTYK